MTAAELDSEGVEGVARPRVLSGIQPTGDIHLGNYLGAIRRWVAEQDSTDSFFCVVDLHALTLRHDPTTLAHRTLETARVLLAAGLDPARCTLFVQSHVSQHSELAWMLNCVATMGELARMVQFKDKSAGQESVSVGLFDYPVLMAADILLYEASEVPVGDDQRQHLELTRDIAGRFNQRFGPTFVVPEATMPKVGARIQDLVEPTRKMSKSADSPSGTVLVLEPAESIRRKIKRAVTDADKEVRFDPDAKPGISNLLSIMSAITGESVDAIAARYWQYGPLKADVADAVIECLRPLQRRHAELAGDPTATDELLSQGADKARTVASATLARARDAMGLA